MSRHRAHISLEIDFSTLDSEDDPSLLADYITRNIASMLKAKGFQASCILDDVTDDPETVNLAALSTNQLAEIITAIGGQLGITLHHSADPGDGKPTIMASHSSGTFTVLNL